MINTNRRSNEPEIMDNFAIEGDLLKDALDKIANINQLLGGNKVTLQGVKFLLSKQDKTKTFKIADLGCGNGDMLRTLSDFAAKENINLELVGVDANSFTVKHAQTLSARYHNITYRCVDFFSDKSWEDSFDIILCTLTLHHFKDQEIHSLLRSFSLNAKLGFVINDLHRSAIAYYLFKMLCFVFRLNNMSREDGLVSILRGFKRSDLERFADHLKLSKYSIKWKWAFRYQWIVETI
jgi:2-polyprenyl-3-methyl-5-hydroxy-6-metoxy-1,4-benzoquinol methylase